MAEEVDNSSLSVDWYVLYNWDLGVRLYVLYNWGLGVRFTRHV